MSSSPRRLGIDRVPGNPSPTSKGGGEASGPVTALRQLVDKESDRSAVLGVEWAAFRSCADNPPEGAKPSPLGIRRERPSKQRQQREGLSRRVTTTYARKDADLNPMGTHGKGDSQVTSSHGISTPCESAARFLSKDPSRGSIEGVSIRFYLRYTGRLQLGSMDMHTSYASDRGHVFSVTMQTGVPRRMFQRSTLPVFGRCTHPYRFKRSPRSTEQPASLGAWPSAPSFGQPHLRWKRPRKND